MYTKTLTIAAVILAGSIRPVGADEGSYSVDFFKIGSPPTERPTSTKISSRDCFLGNRRGTTQNTILRNELQPWLVDCLTRIQIMTGKSLTEDDLPSFSVDLKPKNYIAKLSVSGKSTSVAKERAAVKIIESAAPFKRPPNELPYEKNMVISFKQKFGLTRKYLKW